MCTDAAGNLFHLHVTTSKLQNRSILTYVSLIDQILHQIKEKENQIYGLDYNFDVTQFATGGLDCTVNAS